MEVWVQDPANGHVLRVYPKHHGDLALCPWPDGGPLPHSVSRCDKESFALHCLLLAVSVKFIAARRSGVGKMSWMTAYHAYRTSSCARDSCRFCHTRFHFTFDCLWKMRITGGVFRQRPSGSVSHICVSLLAEWLQFD